MTRSPTHNRFRNTSPWPPAAVAQQSAIAEHNSHVNRWGLRVDDAPSVAEETHKNFPARFIPATGGRPPSAPSTPATPSTPAGNTNAPGTNNPAPPPPSTNNNNNNNANTNNNGENNNINSVNGTRSLGGSNFVQLPNGAGANNTQLNTVGFHFVEGDRLHPGDHRRTYAEWAPFDGYYHNLADIKRGAKDSPLFRRVPPAYADGVLAMVTDRPNPRTLSRELMTGPSGLPSLQNRTALVVYFGQQVVEEILDAQGNHCPREYVNIPIPKGDPLYDPEGKGDVLIPFLRGRYDTKTGIAPQAPREQFNEITPWIDGGLMYGVEKAWSDALRSFKGGLLAEDPEVRAKINQSFPIKNDLGLPMANPPPPRDHTLKMSTRFHRLGNPRGNENPWLLSMGVLWFREHNYQAQRLARLNPDWDDETLFFEARKWTIAMHQRIVTREWLPAFIGAPPDGALPPYRGYDPGVDPQVSHIFQSAAMRWGHTIVTPGVYRRNANCEFRLTSSATTGGRTDLKTGLPAARTCNSFWNPNEATEEYGLGEIFMGMASQVGEREDNIIAEDLLGFVFGPLEFSRRDLMAINIQRGRDHGLPDYNTARHHMGLQRFTDFTQITGDWDTNKTYARRMAELYNNDINNVDVWVGGLLETSNGNPGELFTAVLIDQFARIRDGDRFWYANNVSGPFTDEEILEIDSEANSFRNILLRNNPDIPDARNGLQEDVWHVPPQQPGYCQQPRQLVASDLEPCTPPETFDYYSTSNWQIVGLLITIVGCQIIANMLALFVINYVKRRRSREKRAKESGVNFAPTTSLLANLAQELPPVWDKDGLILYSATSFAGSALDVRATGAAVAEALNAPRPDPAQKESGTPIFLEIDPSGLLNIVAFPEGNRILRSLPLSRVSAILVGGNSDGLINNRLGNNRASSFHQQRPQQYGLFGVQGGTEFPEVLIKVEEYDVWVCFQTIGLQETFVKALLEVLNEKIPVIEETHATIKSSVKHRLDRRMQVDAVLKEAIKEAFGGEGNPLGGGSNEDLDRFGADLRSARPMAAAPSGGFFGRFLSLFSGPKPQENKKRFSMLSTTSGKTDDDNKTLTLREELMYENGEISPEHLRVFHITRAEFAEALGLSLDSGFLRQVFLGQQQAAQNDAVGSDYVSYDGIVTVLRLIGSGSERDRVRFLFSLYDFDGTGSVSRDELRHMLQTLFSDLNTLSHVQRQDLEGILDSWLSTSAVPGRINFDEFYELFTNALGDAPAPAESPANMNNLGFPMTADHELELDPLPSDLPARARRSRTLNIGSGAFPSSSAIDDADSKRNSKLNRLKTKHEMHLQSESQSHTAGVLPPVEEVSTIGWLAGKMADNRMRIVMVGFFFLFCALSFAERYYIFATHRELRGLRTIASYGVAVTRGAAQVQLVAYALVLLSMCRNSITWLRSTWFGKSLPLQYYREFHQIAAWTGLLFSVIHSVGHIINFYNISTQPTDDMLCYFRDTYNYSWELASVYRWLYVTPTGISGVLLVVQLIFMTTFAMKSIRKYAYEAFWFFHRLHPFFYLLMIVHGALQLVQRPFYWYWMLAPTILYRLDTALSSQTKSITFKVLRADALPSGVTRLVLLKPFGFSYTPGQWCRIAVPDITTKEFHPFTISSAPSMPVVTFHILALGDWTSRLRELTLSIKNKAAAPQVLAKMSNKEAKRLPEDQNLPEVIVEGPFDQVLANWDRYRVAIFIGAGIGVTPFVSMLQEIRHAVEHDPTRLGRLRKIYFIWTTKSQRSYEWMVDLLASLENSPLGEILEAHVFITELPAKYDLRTTMLYLTERQFHRFHNKSLFTGLQAPTHFGRPDFRHLFTQIQQSHDPENVGKNDTDDVPANKIGVFTCGPAPICHGVANAVRDVNRQKGPRFLSAHDLFG
ncbi:Dual oxidase 1 [Chytridiales sp. JEL 0842]|nr:Dual oxidase 1 [Chytridiales sp. JEL 0842]